MTSLGAAPNANRFKVFEGRARSRPVFFVLFSYGQRKKHLAVPLSAFLSYQFGRRDWIRTNDPHHVKVVL